jgi:glycosyltransferase involved in cell wall biosynthesis
LIDDHVEGRVVPVCDASALAEAVIAVAGSELLRREMGIAARSRAKRDFDISRMIDDYERLFERISSARVSGPPPG